MHSPRSAQARDTANLSLPSPEVRLNTVHDLTNAVIHPNLKALRKRSTTYRESFAATQEEDSAEFANLAAFNA